MKKTMRFKGLDCANCAMKLEKELGKIKGVKEISISFAASKLMFECEDNKVEEIEGLIKEVTKKREPEVEFLQ